MAKYRMLRDRALTQIPSLRCHEAPTTSDGVIALAHHPHYIHRVVSGALSAEEQRAIGFPWSEAMVERSRRSSGATIAACRSALQQGVAVNLAGGTHHAHADRGQGFCVFNDAAIAARLMQAERRVTRVAIVDLDVHQGDGTASILAHDESIFTLSLHAQNNYPFAKACSDLDVALPDDTGDDAYLLQLQHALNTLFERFDPQLIIYLAGADPYQGDRLGRLSLSMDGLAQRDRLVLEVAKARRLPVAIAMAGGYGHSIDETVAIHLQTLSIASEYVMTQPVSALG
jgi:acetoin utilization deacetylase AcuC-like enzyme